ncbi:hypothetical protein AVEN_64334-1 [Araneus ventricosus]|uniref:Uncharacterized protein n=1 Tax=Araneus ventricosus TaxID=182803 RepID=A0A4Y2DAH6_ARAVE|nr:hypothetical protein AVEN_64334-1 [Araneus ventricosus]
MQILPERKFYLGHIHFSGRSKTDPEKTKAVVIGLSRDSRHISRSFRPCNPISRLANSERKLNSEDRPSWQRKSLRKALQQNDIGSFNSFTPKDVVLYRKGRGRWKFLSLATTLSEKMNSRSSERPHDKRKVEAIWSYENFGAKKPERDSIDRLADEK